MNITQLRKLAAEYGGEIDDDHDSETLTAWAPEGHIWHESQCGCMGVQYGNGMQRWKCEACAELADRIRDGVEKE